MTAALADLVFRGWSDDVGGSGRRSRFHEIESLQASTPHTPNAADAALVERLQAGDRSALESMYVAHAADLERFAGAMLGAVEPARDVVQDIFVWTWETRTRFAPRTSIRAYLFGAVRHRALDAIRRTQVRDRHVVAETIVGAREAVPSPAETLEQGELRAVVAAAFATLTPRVREVAELRWAAQLSYREIAELLGVSERTINTQLTTATRMLRKQLEQYWHELTNT